MGAIRKHASIRKDPSRRRPWVYLEGRYPESLNCLAAFIALEAAEVLAGIKPGNLVRLTDRPQPCGLSLLELWRKTGTEILEGGPMKAEVVREEQGSLLLLFYRPELLRRRLFSRTARTFFRRIGSPQASSLEEALGWLKKGFASGGCPPEVGVFLGYPLKDVAAFMGERALPFSGQRLWRIYGRPHRSQALADAFCECRNRVFSDLSCGADPLALLSGVA